MIFALILTSISLVACTSLSNSNSTAASTTAGTACGKTLSNLYAHYKATGKIDMTNTNTLLQVVELGSYTQGLIANKNDAAYKNAFATGLILGSAGLVNGGNSTSTVNSLISIPSLGGMKSSTSPNSTTANDVASNLTTLLKIFKK